MAKTTVPKKIAIVGCGALGSVFAGLLANAGQQVWAACRWREHLESIQANGLLLLEDEKLIRAPLRLCQATAANRSSMCRDVEQGRQTEIDAINGAVVRLGRERGVSTPANLVLTVLIQAMSPPREIRDSSSF